MKKSTSIRIACEKAQIETIRSLLPYLSSPAAVRDSRGEILFTTPDWKTDDDSENPRTEQITIHGNEGGDTLTVQFSQSHGRLGQDALKSWQDSIDELHQGLSALVKGDRVHLPISGNDDPLAEVKKTYNAALETVERLISVSRLF